MNTVSNHVKVPVLPLREVVVYPGTVLPLFVGRTVSVHCLQVAVENDRKILLVAQKKPEENAPDVDGLCSVGTMSTILQVIKSPDGIAKIVVEGLHRACLVELTNDGKYLSAEVACPPIVPLDSLERKTIVRTLVRQCGTYVQYSRKISHDWLSSLSRIRDVSILVDTVASYFPIKFEHKQFILETFDVKKRFEYLLSLVETEIELSKTENRVHLRIRRQIQKNQREYYLHEQMKAIRAELRMTVDDVPDEHKSLIQRIQSTKMPSEVKKKIEFEFNKFRTMLPVSSEATVARSYIDWMLSVPWYAKSDLKQSIVKAQKVLDRDHYGLDSIKERIVEYLSVQNRTRRNKSPILCFVGPPGVGKTSLGKSIARATNRKYIRMALGGIRDEAEIRGHRRTYIGSMPGKIIQEISKTKVKNPLFLLDEIDKISWDTRGDPASALLEVLDPEQNKYFHDHYLETSCDLSEVMFVSTANSTSISDPLLDRMEVIQISGYTEDEKLHIARRHLIPKQLFRTALSADELTIRDDAVREIVRFYTKESGVRGLEREISKLCRKVVTAFTMDKTVKSCVVRKDDVKRFLGIRRFHHGRIEDTNQIGRVTGLAWTRFGGDLLTIETVCVEGEGKLVCTGSLGKVMKESVLTAFTVLRSLSTRLNLDKAIHKRIDTHVHVPEGSVPKDGPSAGVSICTALVSCLTRNPIKSSVAMTGEITLHGNILPVGGLKEKLLAASRARVKTVLIPKKNRKDLEKVPATVVKTLDVCLVQNINEVLLLACERHPFLTNDLPHGRTRRVM